MVGIDSGAGAISVPVWIAGALAALLLVTIAAALRRGRFVLPAILLAGALSGAGGWLLGRQFHAVEPKNSAADRQLLAQRADELAARALAPESPLACLDAPAGQMVETACEALLFGRPETIAAAVSYVAARLALLSRAAGATGGGVEEDNSLAALRRDLAADRFGFVAHVLSTTSGCDLDRCPGFALVADAQRIKTNMRERRFDRAVARYASSWPSERNAASAAAALRGAAAPPRTIARPLSPGQDFPSAASIPPVNIIAPEPPREPDDEADDKSAAQASAADKSALVPLPRPAPHSAAGPQSSASQPPSARR